MLRDLKSEQPAPQTPAGQPLFQTKCSMRPPAVQEIGVIQILQGALLPSSQKTSQLGMVSPACSFLNPRALGRKGPGRERQPLSIQVFPSLPRAQALGSPNSNNIVGIRISGTLPGLWLCPQLDEAGTRGDIILIREKTPVQVEEVAQP